MSFPLSRRRLQSCTWFRRQNSDAVDIWPVGLSYGSKRNSRRKAMKSKSVPFVLRVTIVCLSALSLWAQGGSSGSQPAAASTPTASQGSATIENQIIAYDIQRQVAAQIAERVKKNCNC